MGRQVTHPGETVNKLHLCSLTICDLLSNLCELEPWSSLLRHVETIQGMGPYCKLTNQSGCYVTSCNSQLFNAKQFRYNICH